MNTKIQIHETNSTRSPGARRRHASDDVDQLAQAVAEREARLDRRVTGWSEVLGQLALGRREAKQTKIVKIHSKKTPSLPHAPARAQSRLPDSECIRAS